MLKELGISSDDTIAGKVFEQLFPNFMNVDYEKPADYVRKYWEAYQKYPDKNNNLNGKIFEYIIATLCIREKNLPLYLGAKVAFVPNVIYDLMFYTAERGPICLSIKTSLRERYKQADLEAIALKYVHRKAMCFLITLDVKEAANIRQKIKTGDVIGIDDVVAATEPDFNRLAEDIKQFAFIEAPLVKVIESNHFITREKVHRVFS